MKPATPLARYFATFTDIVILNVGVMIVSGVLLDTEALMQIVDNAPEQGVTPEQFQQLVFATGLFTIVSLGIVMVFDVLMPASSKMASPGKQLAGIVITDQSGRRIGYGKALVRHAAKFVSLVTVVGFFMPLWARDKQALHDRMSGTMLMKRKGLEVT